MLVRVDRPFYILNSYTSICSRPFKANYHNALMRCMKRLMLFLGTYDSSVGTSLSPVQSRNLGFIKRTRFIFRQVNDVNSKSAKFPGILMLFLHCYINSVAWKDVVKETHTKKVARHGITSLPCESHCGALKG